MFGAARRNILNFHRLLGDADKETCGEERRRQAEDHVDQFYNRVKGFGIKLGPPKPAGSQIGKRSYRPNRTNFQSQLILGNSRRTKIR